MNTLIGQHLQVATAQKRVIAAFIYRAIVHAYVVLGQFIVVNDYLKVIRFNTNGRGEEHDVY
jgi:hypothetical protein